MVDTTGYSFISQAYPDTIEKRMSLFGAVMGLGSALGPLLGLLIFQEAGFSGTFIIFCLVSAPCAFLLFFLPNP